MSQLKAALEAYHMDTLKEIAETLAIAPDRRITRKAELVEELSRAILRQVRSKSFLETLSDVERAALGIACTSKTPLAHGDLVRQLMLSGLVNIEGQPGLSRRPSADDVIGTLLGRGLLINLAEPYGSATLRTFAAPSELGFAVEVRNALPDDRLERPPTDPVISDVAPPAPSEVMSRETQQTLRELHFCWSELRRQPARELKAGGMGKRDRRRLAAALGLDEDAGLPRVQWLYELLEALHLITGNGTTISVVDNHAATLFWGAKPAQQQRDLLRAYTQLTTPLVDDQTAPVFFNAYNAFSGPRPATTIRQTLLSTLEQVTELGWFSFSLLVKLLTAGQRGGLVMSVEWQYVTAGYGRWYDERYRSQHIAKVESYERLVIHNALKELYELGMVDLAYQAPDDVEPTALRAASALRMTQGGVPAPSQSEEPPWQVILQPDFQMLALGPVPLRTLAGLEQFAAREKIDESVITYRLTRDHVYQALQRGETIEGIITYLQEATDQPVPQNIVRSLQAWGQQFERIVIRRAVQILQVDQADALEQLLADPELAPRLHPLGERTAWFLPGDAASIEEGLRRHQMLAAHSHGAEADLPNSLVWHDDELDSRTALPSLYVTGVLRHIAESRNGRWQLTPKSVRRAADLGTDPLAIISQLQEMTGGALPEPWEKRLKSWGNHFGEGQTAHVRLLRLQKHGALAELRRADPALRRWLRPLPGMQDLAVVHESHWDEILRLLASWGVEVATDSWW